MSDTMAALRHKIDSATDLQAVARTMKSIAASRIGQYDQSVRALADYYRTVELGLAACFRGRSALPSRAAGSHAEVGPIGAIVFGSDQGLVGGFNEVVADYAIDTLAKLPGKPQLWAVGERVHSRLQEAGLPLREVVHVPSSVQSIAPLVGQLQVEVEAQLSQQRVTSIYVIHNRPSGGARYEPVQQRLLPLDAEWQRGFSQLRWPSPNLPEVMSQPGVTLSALVREYLFISLFRACAESLASENASRLAAMQRAETNIRDLLDNLHSTFNRLRQNSIDEELFDVVAGYESMT